ncbi:MAG: LacI family DNA-binding transcriptional regulator [bacterium]|nr:LacI family DNA-binding transcriptional regulator [bacterium]
MAVTIPDIAKKAGVAVGTVFRYLNGARHSGYSDLTKIVLTKSQE